MKRLFAILGSSILAIIVILAVLPFTPVTDPDLSARPQPTGSYADAVARIDAVSATEATMDLQPEGRGIAMLTGGPAAKAVVIFHGYTRRSRAVPADRGRLPRPGLQRLDPAPAAPRHGQPDDRRVLQDHCH